jgi:Na+-transporting methylmalonyl-CoA/oxaloacetate decarboxylase gamma subunit
VAGAPVGKNVVVGTGDGLTVVVAGVGVVACVLGVVVGCVVLAEALAEALEVAVPDDDDDADEDPDGEKIAGTLDDGEPVQAETAAATRTIKVAQPRTASRGLLAGLAEVMRTFMEPP